MSLSFFKSVDPSFIM